MRVTDAVIVIGALCIAWSFYRAHRDPSFDFNMFDLLMENGKVSRTAVAFMCALFVTSAVLLRMVVDGKPVDVVFSAYGAMWVAPILARMLNAPPSTQGTP